MKIIFHFIILFFYCNTYCQELKTYSGIYKSDLLNARPGEATYQYFEDKDGDRVFNGGFTYKGTTNNKGETILITGSYKNNLKTGIWRFVITGESYTHQRTVRTITGSYNNGYMDGIWTDSALIEPNKEIYWTVIAHFSDNVLIDNYRSIMGKRLDINVNFDKAGLFDGDYDVKYTYSGIPYEDNRKYKHGQLISGRCQDVTTGNTAQNWEKDEIRGSLVDSGFNLWFCGNDCLQHRCGCDGPLYMIKRGTVLAENVIK